jgi:hypothetical protein
MRIKRTVARLAAGSLLAGSLALAGATGTAFADTPHDPALPGPPAGAMLTAAACAVRDGTAAAGQHVGGNPVRFEYGDSPYVGARYNSCEGTVKIYYGGYTNITHYNVTVNGRQRETRAGERLVLTVPVNPGSPVSVQVQACQLGEWVVVARKPSSCTRFSPPVTVQTQ